MVDPEAIKKEWKEIFSTMDQDQSGSITCNELYKFIVKVVLHLFVNKAKLIRRLSNKGYKDRKRWRD